jgi:hypothetical protein
MTWAAYGPQKPSSDGLQRHPASENDIRVICSPAGQNMSSPAAEGRPQRGAQRMGTVRGLWSPNGGGAIGTAWHATWHG